MTEIIRKTWLATIKAMQGEDEGIVEAIISTGNPDRQGDIVVPSGLRYQTLPPVLTDHRYEARNVVGRVKEITATENTVRATILWDMADPEAKLLYDKIQRGFVNSFSIGFIPLKWEPRESGGYIYREWELIEVSVVAVPANREAMTISVRSVVPFQDLPLDMERSWDAAAARARVAKWAGGPDKETIDWGKYRKAFVWYDEENPDNYGSYKLPIADVVDGRLTAIWRGIVAAMATLLGARGGVDIPEKDREKVYNHLVKYYRKADREPPEFHELSIEELENKTCSSFQELEDVITMLEVLHGQV